jgi:nicotinamide-nucleotide amidase
MTKGALHQIRTDYTIAVSGIMGPDGGTPEKPVGAVWVAVGNYQQIKTKLFHFRFDRTKNIQLTAMNALNLLREFMTERSI